MRIKPIAGNTLICKTYSEVEVHFSIYFKLILTTKVILWFLPLLFVSMQSAEEMLRRFSDTDSKLKSQKQTHLQELAESALKVTKQNENDRDGNEENEDKNITGTEQKTVNSDDGEPKNILNLRTKKQYHNKSTTHLKSSQSNQQANERILKILYKKLIKNDVNRLMR